jgi:hypothetical protein
MRSRRLLLATLPVAALALLAACEKPAPAATVFSGTTSENREAICWSFDADRAFEQGDCSLDLTNAEEFNERLIEKVAEVPTAAGETVGISIDPVVAENGWQVLLNGRPLTAEPVTEKYFRFTMPPGPLRRGSAQLVLQALTEDGTGVRGSWIFSLSAD